MRRLNATGRAGLRFAGLCGHAKVLAFTDAALRDVTSGVEGEDEVSSQGRYVIAEVEATQGKMRRTAQFYGIARRSSENKRVCRSRPGAETLAGRNAADAGYVVKLAIEETAGRTVDMYLVTEPLSLRDHVRRIANNVSERRLKSDLAILKENLEMGELKGLLRIDRTAKVADAMTENSNVLMRTLEQGELDLGNLT